jgi:prolyl-tRNA synthetase
MRLSNLLSKTTKDIPSGEVSKNAILLEQAGYIDKLTAGVYSYLPLGYDVIRNIARIIQEEMNEAGAQEIFMPAIHPKANWAITGRWDNMNVLFKTKSRWGSQEYCLGPTHEEIVVPLVKRFVQSYKDLPTAVYQIQNKFRDEARPKSGLLRGREFIMKDLYSFHKTEEDRAAYYEKMIKVYKKIFKRCGFENVLITTAGGGSFTDKHSHEFQVLTEAGEDTVYVCEDCGYAENAEVAEARGKTYDGQIWCSNVSCSAKNAMGSPSMVKKKAIEIGNIFDLGIKFSEDFDLHYMDEDGQKKPVIIGCYGIGISRIMGALVEHLADDKGLIWPREVAPYDIYLTYFKSKKEEYKDLLPKLAENLYKRLRTITCGTTGHEMGTMRVLFDDRDIRNGRKLAEADVLGIPYRIIISEKTLKAEIEYGKGTNYGAEVKARTANKSSVVGFNEFNPDYLQHFILGWQSEK